MDKNFGKYVITALILIIFSFLIKISINNWNQVRKDALFEHLTLKEISRNLESDAIALTAIHEAYLDARSAANKIEQTTSKTEIQDSLRWWLGDLIQYERFRSIRIGYEALKSKNAAGIKNQDLRQNINSYYGSQVEDIIRSLYDVEKDYSIDWEPKMKADFVDFKFNQYATPRNSSTWVSKAENKFLIKLFNDKRERAIKPLEDGLKSIAEIKAQISQALKPQ